jgi:hypothetical protein
MRKRRWGLSRDIWWLVILLALGGGPIAMAAMFSVVVVVLADVRYLLMDDGGEPVREPAPSDPASVQLRLTVEGDGEVIITTPGGSCSPGETCEYGYSPGDQVTLAAVAGFRSGSNAKFLGWYGDCGSLGRELYPSLIMNVSKDCLARFTPPY